VTRTALVAVSVASGLILGSLSVRLAIAMSAEKNGLVGETTQGMVRSHQPGQDLFKSVLSEDIDWKPFPAFPPSVGLAVVVGRPAEAGPYTVRVRVPRGVKLMPHRHPEDRVSSPVNCMLLNRPFASKKNGSLRQPKKAR